MTAPGTTKTAKHNIPAVPDRNAYDIAQDHINATEMLGEDESVDLEQRPCINRPNPKRPHQRCTGYVWLLPRGQRLPENLKAKGFELETCNVCGDHNDGVQPPEHKETSNASAQAQINALKADLEMLRNAGFPAKNTLENEQARLEGHLEDRIDDLNQE